MARNEEEIAAVLRELPQKPPENMIAEMKKRMTQARLVYRAGYVRDPITGISEKAVSVACTWCGSKFMADYSYTGSGCHCGRGDPFGFITGRETKTTGSTCLCPECGAQGEALHTSHIRGRYMFDRRYFMTIHSIRGHFAALSWVLFEYTDKDANVIYDLKRYEGMVLIDGKPVRFCGYLKEGFGKMSFRPKWESRKQWYDTADEWDEDEIFFVDPIEKTDADKSAADVYIRSVKKQIRVSSYVCAWSRFPHIENLVRSGLSPFIQKVIDSITVQSGYGTERHFTPNGIKRFIDVKKAKPTEMMQLTKEDLQKANRMKPETLLLYRDTLNGKRIRLTYEQLETAERLGITCLQDLIEKEKLPIVRTLNYFRRQMEQATVTVNTRYLMDYWNMQAQISGGKLPEELRFPKDLQKAHDRAVILKMEKEEKDITEKIAAYEHKMQWLSWEDHETGLMIRPARSQAELIKEGTVLSHCVATYAKTMAAGKTCILFIRKKDEPDMPFFTLEYRDGKVQQNRGKRNCARTEEVERFETKWIEHVNEIMKGKKKNGKSANKTA